MNGTTLSRMAAATALGAAVTTVTLLLMQSLIDSDRPSVDEPPGRGTLAFLPAIEESPPEPDERETQPPPKPLPPPPPQRTRKNDSFAVGQDVGIQPPDVEEPGGPAGIGVLSDGDALPVVKVRPAYPARAREQGIEGHVLVQFTIDELGRVVDVKVVEATPRGIFERAALKAVERFRYKPRVVNGEPIPVSGVQHLLTFRLES